MCVWKYRLKVAFMATNPLFAYLFHLSYRSSLPSFEFIHPNPWPHTHTVFSIVEKQKKSQSCLHRIAKLSIIFSSFVICLRLEWLVFQMLVPQKSVEWKHPSLYPVKSKSAHCREKASLRGSSQRDGLQPRRKFPVKQNPFLRPEWLLQPSS